MSVIKGICFTENVGKVVVIVFKFVKSGFVDCLFVFFLHNNICLLEEIFLI